MSGQTIITLGNTRLTTGAGGSVVDDRAYAPFGQQYFDGPINSFFTGVAQSAQAPDIKDFPARNYQLNSGRWLTPDPAGFAAVDLTNPQTLNRYAYVGNNPLSNVDPTGTNWASGLWGKAWNWLTSSNDDESSNPYGFYGGENSGLIFYATSSAHSTVTPQSANLNQQLNSSSPPKNGTNAARWCTVPAPPSGAWPSVQRTAWAASLFVDFLTGTGPANFNFAPDSVPSQGMASTDGVQAALNDYYMTGRTSGLYTFNAPQVIGTGANSMGEFVGSFSWNMTQANGGINLSLSNYTSVWSGAYHQLPSHLRSSFAPLGTTHQTYNIYARCGG